MVLSLGLEARVRVGHAVVIFGFVVGAGECITPAKVFAKIEGQMCVCVCVLMGGGGPFHLPASLCPGLLCNESIM